MLHTIVIFFYAYFLSNVGWCKDHVFQRRDHFFILVWRRVIEHLTSDELLSHQMHVSGLCFYSVSV